MMIDTNDFLNAEEAVLGSAILSEEAADTAVSLLTEENFTSAANKTIFAAIEKLRKDRKPLDLVLLVDALGDRIADIGGLPYLSKLSCETPSDANIAFYISAVQEAHRRRLFSAGMQEAQKAMVEGGDYLTAAQKAIDSAAALVGKSEKPTTEEWADTILSIGRRQLGIRTGYPSLDRLMGGLRPGHTTIVAGRTSMGKTSFALGLVVNAALQKKTVAVFSLEMTKSDIMRRACHFLAKVSKAEVLAEASGNGDGSATVAMMDAADKLSKSKFYVFDDANTIAKIRERCWEIKRQEGRLDVVMIDYLGLMRSEGGRKNGTREQEVSENSRAVKRLAMDFGSSVLLLSQLNRQTDTRPDPKPVLSDLRESGSVEQDADEVILLYRPIVYERSTDEKEAYMFLAKNRDGGTGSVELLWYGDRFCYAEPEEEPTQTTLTDDPDCPFE